MLWALISRAIAHYLEIISWQILPSISRLIFHRKQRRNIATLVGSIGEGGGQCWHVLQTWVFVLLISVGKWPRIQSRRALNVASFVWEAFQYDICVLTTQERLHWQRWEVHLAQHSMPENGTKVCFVRNILHATSFTCFVRLPWSPASYNSPWLIRYPGMFKALLEPVQMCQLSGWQIPESVHIWTRSLCLTQWALKKTPRLRVFDPALDWTSQTRPLRL